MPVRYRILSVLAIGSGSLFAVLGAALWMMVRLQKATDIYEVERNLQRTALTGMA